MKSETVVHCAYNSMSSSSAIIDETHPLYQHSAVALWKNDFIKDRVIENPCFVSVFPMGAFSLSAQTDNTLNLDSKLLDSRGGLY